VPGPLFVGAEGIILRPNRKIIADAIPITEGLELVTALMHDVTRLVVFAATDSERDLTYFCKMNGLPKAQVVIEPPEDRCETYDDSQWNALSRERARGPINLVITGYKSIYEQCLATRQAVILFGRRGTVGTLDSTKSWDELQDAVKSAREAGINESFQEG
jgi:hypothetical protein